MGLLFNISVLCFIVAVVALNILISGYLTVKNSDTQHLRQDFVNQLTPLNEEERDTFVFVHISDLHISHFADPERYDQLKEFCHFSLKAINPKLVVASGDLTDSIAPDKVIATQFIEEWEMYKDLYTKCKNESSVTHWLDLRGNHDNFNVDGYNSTNNFYPKFGSQRSQSPGSYMVTVQTSASTKYAFIGVDATLQIGPKRILNFVGQLDDDHLRKLEDFERSAIDSNVNASIWFGHYPTSSILSTGLLPGLRNVAAKGIAYLCGHFHTWGGVVPQMYSHHHSGLLELELADWKHNRMYRVAVLDQGLFSFADVQHKAWPVIVVTNPKPLITVQPSKEPTRLMATSSHIRLFIFSPSPIDICEVKLDEGAWEPCKFTGKEHPLFTAPWQPELYAEGRHVLQVRAKDSTGSEVSTRIDFALDKTQPYFPFMARVALMMDITTVSQMIFAVTIILGTVPFCIFRYLQYKIIHRQMTMCRIRNRWIRLWIRKLWIFASINSLFYPYLAYTLYLAVGPWFIGHLIDGRVGMVFVWGSFFEGGPYLPGTMTFFYGSIHLWFFNGILVLFLAHTADVSFQEIIIKKDGSRTSWRKIALIISFVIFIAIHTFTCYLFWLSYGDLATFVNPMRTWSIVFAACLWVKAVRLNELSLLNVAKTWN